MDAKKMTVATLVGIAAVAACVFAMLHSRAVLAAEQDPYPPGTLALGESATFDGVTVEINEADVVSSIADADSRGYDRMTPESSYRFVRLDMAITNSTDKPIETEAICDRLTATEISTGSQIDARLVWQREVDALPKKRLEPGERVAGHVSLEMWEYALSFPFVVSLDGQASWGVDVVDHDAPL